MAVTPPWPTAVPTATEPNPPLTTRWHVPDNCTWTYDPHHTESEVIAWLDFAPRPDDPVSSSTLSCYPSGMFDGDAWGVFSPASCPHGWTTVGVSAETDRPAEGALTTATCCSSNYVYQDGYCGRSIPYVVAVPITYITIGSETTYSVLTESTTVLVNATIAVHTILAEWRAAEATAVHANDPDDGGDPGGDGGGGGGLSTNARAGIGVGVCLGVLVVGAVIWFLHWRRGKPRH